MTIHMNTIIKLSISRWRHFFVVFKELQKELIGLKAAEGGYLAYIMLCGKQGLFCVVKTLFYYILFECNALFLLYEAA